MGNRIDMGRCVTEAWELYKAEWQTWSIAMAIFITIISAAASLVVPVFFIAGPFTAGLLDMAFKQMRGEEISIGDMFGGFERWWETTALFCVIAAVVTVGSLALIVPAFIFMGWYLFAFPLMVEEGMGWADALTASKKLAKGAVLDIIILHIGLSTIASLGSYVCGVGFIVTAPIYYIGLAIAYKQLRASSETQGEASV